MKVEPSLVVLLVASVTAVLNCCIPWFTCISSTLLEMSTCRNALNGRIYNLESGIPQLADTSTTENLRKKLCIAK